jgi:hypothetical protein
MLVDTNTKPKTGRGLEEIAMMMNGPVDLTDKTLVSRKLAGILKHSYCSIASMEGVKAIDSSKTVIDTPKITVRTVRQSPLIDCMSVLECCHVVID